MREENRGEASTKQYIHDPVMKLNALVFEPKSKE